MVRAIAWGFALIFLIGVAAFILGFFGDAAKTVKKEYAPSALLKKYESFKDLSAAIDKKRADIEVYAEGLSEIDRSSKDGRFYYEQRRSEVIGIISIHNQLCADYNSQMSKFNYRFTNKGDLPQTNMEPLPREYKPYILSIKNTTQ